MARGRTNVGGSGGGDKTFNYIEKGLFSTLAEVDVGKYVYANRAMWIDDGSSVIEETLSEYNVTSDGTFGKYTTEIYTGQSVTTTKSFNKIVVRLEIAKIGSPTDDITIEAYEVSGDLPTNLIGTSEEIYNGTVLDTTYLNKAFTIRLTKEMPATKIAFVVKRSGSADASNYYKVYVDANESYTGGIRIKYNTSTGWETSSSDVRFGLDFITEGQVIPSQDNAISVTELQATIAGNLKPNSPSLLDGFVGFVSKDNKWVAPSL